MRRLSTRFLRTQKPAEATQVDVANMTDSEALAKLREVLNNKEVNKNDAMLAKELMAKLTRGGQSAAAIIAMASGEGTLHAAAPQAPEESVSMDQLLDFLSGEGAPSVGPEAGAPPPAMPSAADPFAGLQAAQHSPKVTRTNFSAFDDLLPLEGALPATAQPVSVFDSSTPLSSAVVPPGSVSAFSAFDDVPAPAPVSAIGGPSTPAPSSAFSAFDDVPAPAPASEIGDLPAPVPSSAFAAFEDASVSEPAPIMALATSARATSAASASEAVGVSSTAPNEELSSPAGTANSSPPVVAAAANPFDAFDALASEPAPDPAPSSATGPAPAPAPSPTPGPAPSVTTLPPDFKPPPPPRRESTTSEKARATSGKFRPRDRYSHSVSTALHLTMLDQEKKKCDEELAAATAVAATSAPAPAAKPDRAPPAPPTGAVSQLPALADLTASAKFAFSADDENWQVSVQAGEPVHVLQDHGDGWLEVRASSGRRGSVPKDFIDLGLAEMSIANAPAPALAPAIAAFTPTHTVDFAFDSPDGEWQISTAAGDLVRLITTHDDGWSEVATAVGTSGMVPTEYLSELP